MDPLSVFFEVNGYPVPGEVRRAAKPVRKGWFGSIIEPAPLTQFRPRAYYVINGIMKQGINSVATLHESGFVHRSIGRSSFILSSTSMDKREASLYDSTNINQSSVKLTDFGFSRPYD